jgi:hypothetical protein
MPRKKKAAEVPECAPASHVRLAGAPSDHAALHELLEFTRKPLLDTVESLENAREEARAILKEWVARGESGKWLHNHYINRLMAALGMDP